MDKFVLTMGPLSARKAACRAQEDYTLFTDSPQVMNSGGLPLAGPVEMVTLKPAGSDFTQGRVGERILRLALPMMLAQLVNLLYSVVDRIYLGRLPGDGALALAGVGLVFPIITIITAFTNLCGTGGVPLFSIARGAGDDERAASIQGNCLSLLLLLAAGITAAGLLFKEPILRLIGASPATFVFADEYLTVYLCGTVFSMCGLGMNGFIGAQGFGTRGMMTVLLGAALNLVLDPLLIFTFGMGVRGAALATVMAQACSALWALAFLSGKKAVIRLRLQNLRPRLRIIGRTLALGVSGFTMAMTNSLIGALYNITLQALGGDLYVSVMVIIHSVQEIVQLPGHSLTQAAQPVLSYNYGAGRGDRVRRAFVFVSALSFALHLVCWAAVMLAPAQIIRVFNDDPALVEAGVRAVRAYFAVFFLLSLQGAGQCGFVALDKTRQAVFFSLLRKVVLILPCIFLFGYGMGLGADGIFYAEPVSHVLGSTVCFATFMLTVWRKLEKKPG